MSAQFNFTKRTTKYQEKLPYYNPNKVQTNKFVANPEEDKKVSDLKAKLGAGIFQLIRLNIVEGHELLNGTPIQGGLKAMLMIIVKNFDELKEVRPLCIQYCKKPTQLGLSWDAATQQIYYKKSSTVQYCKANDTVTDYKQLDNYVKSVITYMDERKSFEALQQEIEEMQAAMEAAMQALPIEKISSPHSQEIQRLNAKIKEQELIIQDCKDRCSMDYIDVQEHAEYKKVVYQDKKEQVLQEVQQIADHLKGQQEQEPEALEEIQQEMMRTLQKEE